MRLMLTGRRIAITDAIRQQVDTKLQRLERLLNDSAVSAQCVIGRQRQLFVCELTVHARGDHMLHGLGQDARLAGAVTAAVDKVGQQAQRLKDRWKTRRRAGASRAATPVEEAEAPSSARTPRVIPIRRAGVKPMSLDDAVLALTSGRQPFLVFRHAGSGSLAILYRRPDGHFGLIDSEA
jgi:ribosome hibernation promoting factor